MPHILSLFVLAFALSLGQSFVLPQANALQMKQNKNANNMTSCPEECDDCNKNQPANKVEWNVNCKTASAPSSTSTSRSSKQITKRNCCCCCCPCCCCRHCHHHCILSNFDSSLLEPYLISVLIIAKVLISLGHCHHHCHCHRHCCCCCPCCCCCGGNLLNIPYIINETI